MSQLLSVLRPPSVRSLRLATNRGTFAALSAAPSANGHRGTALLVPGFSGSKEDFLPLLPLLSSAGYEAFAIDLRGQYETGPASPFPSYEPSELAADLIAVAESLAHGPIHLLGHSYGGLVARLAVLSNIATWASLTLMNFGPAAVSAPQQARLGLLVEALKTASLRDLWPFLRPADDNIPEEVQDFLSSRWAMNVPEALRLVAQHMMSEPDRTAELRATGVPVSVISGTPDETWPERQSNEMADRLGARFTEVPGGGHSPNVHRPQAVVNALVCFWSNHASTPSGVPPLT